MCQELGIHNIDRIRLESVAANSEAGCSKLPDAVGRINVNVGDSASVLGRVDETEVISAWLHRVNNKYRRNEIVHARSAILQVSGKDRRAEAWLHSVKECLLSHRLDYWEYELVRKTIVKYQPYRG